MKAVAATEGPAPAKLMGIREYARHRAARGAPGATHSAVRKAIESGRLAAALVAGDRGRQLIDQEKADLEWGLTTDPAQQRHPDEQRKPEEVAAAAPRQLLITGESVDANQDQEVGPENALANRARVGFSVQRARTAAAKAELAELDLAERRNELISRVKVTDEYYRQATKLREAIMAVPRRMSGRLTPKMVAVLEEELRKALRSLPDGGSRRR